MVGHSFGRYITTSGAADPGARCFGKLWPLRHHQQQQADAADDTGEGSVIEHGDMADPVHSRPATILATSRDSPTVVLYQPTPLARGSSGTKSDANALPTARNIP